MHTDVSPDSDLRLKDLCTLAIRKGLKEICITDHYCVKKGCIHYQTKSTRDAQIKEIKKIRKQFPKLKIRYGIEMDYHGDNEKEIHSFLNHNDIDFVIGSLHYYGFNLLDKPWFRLMREQLRGFFNHLKKIASKPSGKHLYKARSLYNLTAFPELYFRKKKYLENYYALMKKAIQSELFDVIGHCTEFTRYAHFQYSQYKEYLKECAALMKKHKVGFEINMGLLFSPDEESVALLVNHGVKNITIGSDTHNEHQLRYADYAKAKKILQKCGIKKICSFHKRKRTYEVL